jgi:7-cyano-7-deazaguanine synthase
MNKKAVILLSGGLDTSTCLALAQSQGFDCYALTFNYGQKNHAEINAARKLTQLWNVKEHKVVRLDISSLCESALTTSSIDVPDYTVQNAIPSTYVPARNTIFLSIAMGWAEVLGAQDIFTGVSKMDYSGYPDCRPEFITAFENLANVATKSATEGTKLTIHTPLMYLSKSETIKIGMNLGVDYSLTVTCYRPDDQGLACGNCLSCTQRKHGFLEAGVPDVTRYQATFNVKAETTST